MIVPVGTNVKGYCYTGCPSGQVRVALDQYGGGCEGDRGRAKCYKLNYMTLSKRSYTDLEQELADNVEAFMEDPVCEYKWFNKRSLGAGWEYRNTSHGQLERRSSSKPRDNVEQLLYSLVVTYSATAAGLDI
ncbi:chitinase [Aspergillus sp. HF37]|nr:chitinase [Aspergillus sp. HF37]